MDCKVELKKHVFPVLRRPLYFGLDSRVLGAVEDREEALDVELERLAERARRNGCDLSDEAEGVHGWRRDAACRPGLSISLYMATAKATMRTTPTASNACVGSVTGKGNTPKSG